MAVFKVATSRDGMTTWSVFERWHDMPTPTLLPADGEAVQAIALARFVAQVEHEEESMRRGRLDAIALTEVSE
jgi:hypothetical protein